MQKLFCITRVKGNNMGLLNTSQKTIYYNNSIDFYNNEDYEESITSLKKALELDKEYVAAYYQLAQVYNELEDDDNIIENLNKVIELDKQNQTGYLIDAYLQRADAFICKDLYETAKKDLNK